MGALAQAHTGKEKADAAFFEDRKFGLLRIAFWIVAGITGFLQIWLTDRVIWADTVSYLDSGDLLWRGDFANAITNHWSPGFPFLLGLALKILHPVGTWEVAVVKLVDLIVFLFAIACFDYFVVQLCRYHDDGVHAEYSGAASAIPKLALASAGYLLFLWTIAHLLPAWYTTPDMLVLGIEFVVFGLLVRIKMGAIGWMPFAILGAVLGCGYLAKAPLFPLAFLFVGTACFLVKDRKKALQRGLLAFAVFALIAAPLVIRLSTLAGGLTFGKSGAWNYARIVNGIAVPYHWHGQPAGSGTPQHPTRILFQTPTVYEFGSPVLGTFPPWRDPYYWFAGITPHFELAGQVRVLKANVKTLIAQASELNAFFYYGFLILLCVCSDWRLMARIIAKQWFLFLPALGALAMFSIVLVEDRYIAPYPIVVGLVVFSGVAIARSKNSLRLVYVTVLLAAASLAASALKPAENEMLSFAHSLHKNDMLGRGGPWHVTSASVSNALGAHGLRRGDRVAYIGRVSDFYWARLAGVQVNAEIRQWDLDKTIYAAIPHSAAVGLEPSVDEYWAASSEVKGNIDRVLSQAGSKAIVTDAFPAGGAIDGWTQVTGTSFYIHMLPTPPQSAGN